MQRELDTLVVFCKYKNLGCEWQGVLKEWEGHSEGCKFKGVSCPFSGCGQMVLTSELEQHKLECSFRPSQCEYCKLQLQFHELEVFCMLLPQETRDLKYQLYRNILKIVPSIQ